MWNIKYATKRCHRLYVDKQFVHYNSNLYHYTKSYAALSICKSKELWLTKYDGSNDPKEFRLGLDLICNELKRHQKLNHKIDAIFDKFIAFYEEEIKSPGMHFYMICFCTSHQNKYLAKYYARNKKGSCLDVNLSNKDFNNDKPIMYKVIYSQRKFKRILSKLLTNYSNLILNNFQEWTKDGVYDEMNKEVFVLLLRDLFLLASRLKHHRFAPEKEVRLVAWDLDTSTSSKYIIKILNSDITQIRF